MAKTALREQAIKLRLQGYTYSQIKQQLGLQKSTLSNWLKNTPLSPEQFELLSKNRSLSKDIRIENYRKTMINKRLEIYKNVFKKQSKKLLPLSKKELLVAGLFLYWGEGEKLHGRVGISNTNPLVIQFAKYWFTKILGVPKSKLAIRLHLYEDMDIDLSTEFWSQLLKISKDQFKTPYIKKSKRSGISYKSYGYGTCNLMCHKVALSEKIAMSIKAIAESCGAKSNLFWYN